MTIGLHVSWDGRNGNFDVSRAKIEVEQDLASSLHRFNSGSQIHRIILCMLAAQ